MVKKRLPTNVSEFKDRHDKWRMRFRKKGFATYYFKSKYGTKAWEKEYQACRDGQTPRTKKTHRVPAGSFAALVALYYQSPEFRGLRITTQATYRGTLRRFLDEHGTKRVDRIQRIHIKAILGKMEAKPSAANNLLDRLRPLMTLALDIGWITVDPTLRVKGYKIRSSGFPPWSEEEVQKFEQFYPVGTKPRLALDLLLYTGQRRGDIVQMGKQHIKNGAICIRQQKTGAPVEVPISHQLALSIATLKHNHLTFLVTEYEQPYSSNGFGNWFRKKVRAAGIEGRSAHGLRKVASRRLAEAGSTNSEIKSVTGHRTDKEVQRYTESANKLTLATSAINKTYGNKK
ncbi:tyrosine-type recombinase/integrase [Maritalea sp.]|uniref:tyrosine-type recombinase/integrase n=1 Tax=Maritalea sp. TaxID=2003361 RepID=UPI003EFB229B